METPIAGTKKKKSNKSISVQLHTTRKKTDIH